MTEVPIGGGRSGGTWRYVEVRSSRVGAGNGAGGHAGGLRRSGDDHDGGTFDDPRINDDNLSDDDSVCDDDLVCDDDHNRPRSGV